MKKLFPIVILGLCASLNVSAQSDYSGSIGTRIPAAPNSPYGLRGSFGLSVSNGKTLNFDSASVKTKSGTTYKGTSEFGVDPTYSLEIGLQQIPAEGWGASAFISYDSRIKVTTFNDSFAGTKTKGTYNQEPSLDLLTFSGNAVYSLGRIYLPVGVNLTLPTYESKISTSATGAGLGFQLGAGFYAMENLAFDLIYKRRTFQLKEKFDSGVTFNYGDGNLDGIGLQARLLF